MKHIEIIDRFGLGIAFPLTPALSPAERGQPLATFLKSESRRAEAGHGFAKTLGAFLPLRWGEGRGEAKRGCLFCAT